MLDERPKIFNSDKRRESDILIQLKYEDIIKDLGTIKPRRKKIDHQACLLQFVGIRITNI